MRKGVSSPAIHATLSMFVNPSESLCMFVVGTLGTVPTP